MAKRKLTAEQLAEAIITEMKDAGLSPNQMLELIKRAREKYLKLQSKK